ncbi:MAG: S8 family serine peptidase, partial [Thermoanaerobaculia bacterium]
MSYSESPSVGAFWTLVAIKPCTTLDGMAVAVEASALNDTEKKRNLPTPTNDHAIPKDTVMKTTTQTSTTLIAVLVALVVLSVPGISVAGGTAPAQGSGRLEISGNKVKWTLTNETGSRIYLEDLHLEWPEANGSVKKIKLAGDVYRRFASPPSLHVEGLWDGNLDDRKIDPYQVKALEIEFENDAELLVNDYFLEADFGGGSSLVFIPFSADCPIRVSGNLALSGDKAKLAFTNDGDSTEYLADLQIGWPAINGQLEKVKWDGHTLWEELSPAPTLTVDAVSQVSSSDRRIDPGHTGYLEVQFAGDVDPMADRYQIQTDFGADCSLIFTPNGARATGVTPFDASYVIYADILQSQGITGDGVTVAVVDTGIWQESRLKKNRHDDDRIVAEYNALKNETGKGKTKDKNGHGTHVASLVSNSERFENTFFAGVAPDVNLVVVQGFDEEGKGRYADVIRGLDWILQNKNA